MSINTYLHAICTHIQKLNKKFAKLYEVSQERQRSEMPSPRIIIYLFFSVQVQCYVLLIDFPHNTPSLNERKAKHKRMKLFFRSFSNREESGHLVVANCK